MKKRGARECERKLRKLRKKMEGREKQNSNEDTGREKEVMVKMREIY